VFFRLKKPDYAIVGYGFFVHFGVVDLHTAWSAFGWKNGDPDKRRFFERMRWGLEEGWALNIVQEKRNVKCDLLRPKLPCA
jgi:hypothetical protein